jgi:enoyl-CoA hydratase
MTVSVVTVGHVAHLTLGRPEVLNAIDTATCRAIAAGLDLLEEQGEASVLIVSGGSARCFSAGADLKHMRGLAAEDLRRFIELTWRCFDRLAASPIVSIAALHGYALGGGAELALACDLRVAAEDAVIGFPEMTLGSVPGSGGMQRLPPLIGASRALELVATGRRLSGAEAAALGLVNRCVAPGQALVEAEALAAILAARPAAALRYAKASLRASADLAPALHGLISAICHQEPAYNANVAAVGHNR